MWFPDFLTTHLSLGVALKCVSDVQVSRNDKAVTIFAFPHLRPKSRQDSNRLQRLRTAGPRVSRQNDNRAGEDKCALSGEKQRAKGFIDLVIHQTFLEISKKKKYSLGH